MPASTPRLCSNNLALLAAALLSPGLVSTTVQSADYRHEIITQDLHHPWSVAQLPDHSFLVSERDGQLLHIPAEGGAGRTVKGVPETYVAGQGGFFDVLLHPDFARNRLVYLSFAHGTPDSNGTAVVRGRLGDTGLEDVTRILLVQDSKDTPQHYAARMLFLSDGTLLVATGDGFNYREQAQNLNSELGKVLRINDDGSVPADNPFTASARPRIFTYGHRNTQGLALDADSGTIYLHEHGPKGGDELNVLRAGNNYGWPAITYGVDYNGAYVSPFTELPGMEQPLHYWLPSIAPSGMAWYGGDRFPEWRGDLFVGALVDQEVRRLDMEQGAILQEEPLFSELNARIRDVYSADDGYLYLLTDSEQGALVRIMPAED